MTPKSLLPAVKATALRMDAITDVAAIIATTVLILWGGLDVYHGLGVIGAIAGLMKMEHVRKRGGAVIMLLGAAATALKGGPLL